MRAACSLVRPSSSAEERGYTSAWLRACAHAIVNNHAKNTFYTDPAIFPGGPVFNMIQFSIYQSSVPGNGRTELLAVEALVARRCRRPRSEKQRKNTDYFVFVSTNYPVPKTSLFLAFGRISSGNVAPFRAV